jgi:DMSO/TMAO reductase YedYZ molybdopterin-dependent catalytic subunit
MRPKTKPMTNPPPNTPPTPPGDDRPKAKPQRPPLTPEQQINRRTFYSFTAFIVLGIAAWRSWFWLKDSAQSDGVQSPLRQVLNTNEKIFKHTLSPNHLAKTYPTSAAARNVRYNSGIGLGTKEADPTIWRLNVTTRDGRTLSISLDELKTLPKTEFAFEFKCIEGWSQISWWGGVKFSDFIRHYNLQHEATLDYVGLSTPDDQYYVGIDTPSTMHPQTLLCYEMNGQPLPPRHGAPLRLIIPIKYGVKNLKCISKMYFSNDRPRDYWFERGYDYYCGL